MDDSTPSTPSNELKSTQRISLGMSSFGKDEQQRFGQNVRLAMACIEGAAKPVNVKAMPSNATDISQRLKVLSQDITSSLADQIELLVRFDDLQGWKSQRRQPLCRMDGRGIGRQPETGLGVFAHWPQIEAIAHNNRAVQSWQTLLVQGAADCQRGQ